MILPDARETATAQIEQALREEVGDDSLLRDRAENLMAIAIEYGIDFDDLTKWIHYRKPDKQWSADEFRNWAKKLRETIEALTIENARSCGRLCPNCFSHTAQHTIDGHWWCPQCGLLP